MSSAKRGVLKPLVFGTLRRPPKPARKQPQPLSRALAPGAGKEAAPCGGHRANVKLSTRTACAPPALRCGRFFSEGIPVSRFREAKFGLIFRCGVPAEHRVQPLRVPARQL